MLFVPTGNEDVLRVATPLDNVPVPSVLVPFLKVTVPGAVEGVMVAVSVMLSPWNGLEFET